MVVNYKLVSLKDLFLICRKWFFIGKNMGYLVGGGGWAEADLGCIGVT